MMKYKIYRTIILPVVLYRCETWSLTLSEEHRLKIILSEPSVVQHTFIKVGRVKSKTTCEHFIAKEIYSHSTM